VDTFLSAEQTRELADWIAASGKNLTAIYVTHAHGDHFFGIGMLEERFPGARAVATAEVIEGMRHQISPEYMAAFWSPRFPGQLPDRLTVAAEIPDGGIGLEGFLWCVKTPGRSRLVTRSPGSLPRKSIKFNTV
jgi:glyoxylase-like metal-dependent hydrolase (beta-lactamase superfamily II)